MHCDPFYEPAMLFVPSGMEKNDSLIFHNHNGDTLIYIAGFKDASQYEEFSSCDDHRCESTFTLRLSRKYNYDQENYIRYFLIYTENNPDKVSAFFDVDSNYYEFKFNMQGDKLTAITEPVIETLEINGINYQDVIILNNEKQEKEIYAAKKHGIIQMIDKKTNEKWVLAKQ